MSRDGEREGGCAHRRRRGSRRCRRVEPRGYAHEHPVPGTGRLDGPGAVPEYGRGLGAKTLRRFLPEPELARPARGLPGQRQRVADLGIELQRGRRQHHPLRRTLPALPPFGLPRQDARRRRRRLADRLRDPRALVRAKRSDDGHRRPRGRPRRIRRRSLPCPRCRSENWAKPWRAASTRSAGTGGPRTAPSRPRSTAGAPPCINLGPCI